jgi:hypothetical protein
MLNRKITIRFVACNRQIAEIKTRRVLRVLQKAVQKHKNEVVIAQKSQT